MSLQRSFATSDTERQKILDSFGTTIEEFIEEFNEFFGHGSGSTGPDDG